MGFRKILSRKKKPKTEYPVDPETGDVNGNVDPNYKEGDGGEVKYLPSNLECKDCFSDENVSYNKTKKTLGQLWDHMYCHVCESHFMRKSEKQD